MKQHTKCSWSSILLLLFQRKTRDCIPTVLIQPWSVFYKFCGLNDWSKFSTMAQPKIFFTLLLGLLICTDGHRLQTSSQQAWFSGLNVPWNSFGYDIGTDAYDPDYFETFFQFAESNSQNAARFWVHCDGRQSPLFDDNTGVVNGLSDSFLPNLIDLVRRASAHNVLLQLCMWSFDMCTDETTPRDATISDSSITQSYIDNALNPILDALNSNQLSSSVLIEVINEPEWCMEGSCSTTDCVSVSDMQRFVGMQAAAIHAKGFKVTVGSASLKWNANNGRYPFSFFY
jgi:hypothetical protein